MTVERAVFDRDSIPADMMGMDIGPKTVELYTKELCIEGKDHRMELGPAGVFEMPNFAAGTKAIAQALAERRCRDSDRRR